MPVSRTQGTVPAIGTAAVVYPTLVTLLALLAWLTFASIVLCVLLWNYGVRQAGIVVATMYLNLVPIVALAILAWMGSMPSLLQIIGAALVILGIFYSEWQQYRQRRQQAMAVA